MSILDWFFFVVLFGVVLFGARGLFFMWRHPEKPMPKPPSWWLWGELTFRAWLRAMPVSLLFVAAMLPAVLLYELGEGGASGPGDEGIERFAIPLYMLGALLIILAVLLVIIIFYNRPKILILPHLRAEPGIVEAREQRTAPPRD